MTLRYDWAIEEIETIYSQPFLNLVFEAQTVHRRNFRPDEIQKSTLVSIKTGGCAEDCGYCSQSAHHKTDVPREPLIPLEVVLKEAREAKGSGSSRLCMGAAWREVTDGPDFERVLEMVRGVSTQGMEVCCTLGMVTEGQAKKLKEAGLTAYNHNLDTSPEFYDKIVTTRTYDDRLKTLENIRKAGIQVCCGGIIGLGESRHDRFRLLQILSNQTPHPESVPINKFVKVEGTPLPETELDTIEFVRTIATARLLMPKSLVRLSAGRASLSDEAQTLCFLAGANSIFAGEKLLTTPNRDSDLDAQLFAKIGLREMPTASCGRASTASEGLPTALATARIKEARPQSGVTTPKHPPSDNIT